MDPEPKTWLEEDESAKEMMCRLLVERPLLLLPPLHRVPLRVGNIVEIVGPSPSAKTHILFQAAINCILPKEWNGVKYGGLGHLVMFIDLDCRFDVSRFSQMLIYRINETTGAGTGVPRQKREDGVWNERRKDYDEELFALCMRRLLYVRCYDSFEFLATLKTLRYQLRKEKDAHGLSVHLLMIDSIGAFYWMDRGFSSFPLEAHQLRTKNCLDSQLQYVAENLQSLIILSAQSVFETVVQELRKLLIVHPMLVMATKADILADRKIQNVASYNQQLQHREYMPSTWQSFVTHRVLVRATGDASLTDREHEGAAFFVAEWLLPPLTHIDKFIMRDAGLQMVS